MVNAVAWALVAAMLALAGWATVAAVRGRRPSGAQLVALAVAEAVLLVQAVGGVVALARGDHEVSTVTFAGYLLASVVVLPLGALWGIADHSRWGNGVIAIACFVVAVVMLRLLQVWG